MNDSKYRYILYVIVIVILSTIGIQAYWNYKNYQTNKLQLITDVQTSLDKAVDDYYTEIAKETTLGLQIEGNAQKDVFDKGGFLDELSKSIDESNKQFKNLDSIDIPDMTGVTVIRDIELDSFEKRTNDKKHLTPEEFKQQIKELKGSIDNGDSISFEMSNIELLTSKIFVSIRNDSLDLKAIDHLLKADLKRKNIDLNYQLDYYEAPSNDLKIELKEPHQSQKDHKLLLSNRSQSNFLPKNSELKIYYQNETWVILKRIIWSILISTLLVLAVISCLFYLLKIIKRQKQLAEVKNDLISNITHEFKTPIATIGVALESMQNFNAIDDKEKAKSYLDMSRTQLSKLNMMVEKLLETASLDSEHLELNSDRYNISEIIMSIAEKHKLQNSTKILSCSVADNVFAKVDIFHFENAINNIIDNAFKYGGDEIFIDLKTNTSGIEIAISDNGNSLSKADKDRIFEKFYRVPKGNTHDVKGFGIGLYYAKKIIEKHNGTINVAVKNGLTTFKIYMPNA